MQLETLDAKHNMKLNRNLQAKSNIKQKDRCPCFKYKTGQDTAQNEVNANYAKTTNNVARPFIYDHHNGSGSE